MLTFQLVDRAEVRIAETKLDTGWGHDVPAWRLTINDRLIAVLALGEQTGDIDLHDAFLPAFRDSGGQLRIRHWTSLSDAVSEILRAYDGDPDVIATRAIDDWQRGLIDRAEMLRRIDACRAGPRGI
jgi:hypothetical protein